MKSNNNSLSNTITRRANTLFTENRSRPCRECAWRTPGGSPTTHFAPQTGHEKRSWLELSPSLKTVSGREANAMPILQKTFYAANAAPLSVPDRDRTKQQLNIVHLSIPDKDYAKQEKQNTMSLSTLGRDHAKQNSNSVPLSVLDRDRTNRQLTITQLSMLDRNNPNASPLGLFVFPGVEFLIVAAGGVFVPGPLEDTETKQEERFLQHDERTCLQLLQGREPP